MKNSSGPSNAPQCNAAKYCDRCARRSAALFYDDLTLQDLCQECQDRLKRRRDIVFYPSKPKM